MTAIFLEWIADFGDPTPFPWVVTVGYLIASLLCWRVGAAEHERWAWRSLSILLLLGGLNKQLDLQTLMIDVARHAFTGTVWFADRRMLQAAFMAGLGLGATGVALWLVRRARGWSAHARLAWLGATAIAVFWMLRAGTINHLGGDEGGHGGALQGIELIGVLTVIVAAALDIRGRTANGPARI